MAAEIKDIATIYPKGLLDNFPSSRPTLTMYSEFLQKMERDHGTTIVNANTPPETIWECAQNLQKIAITIGKGISSGSIDTETLYRLTTKPARDAGKLGFLPLESQVGVIPEEHHYFVLKRDKSDSVMNNLLVLLQRIPFGVDTGPEYHGSGIEVYLPLTDNIDFFINDTHQTPGALEKLITVLPGDIHHHVKQRGSGPARVLIFGGFGLSRGWKSTDTSFIVPGFSVIPRIRSL